MLQYDSIRCFLNMLGIIDQRFQMDIFNIRCNDVSHNLISNNLIHGYLFHEIHHMKVRNDYLQSSLILYKSYKYDLLFCDKSTVLLLLAHFISNYSHSILRLHSINWKIKIHLDFIHYKI